MLLVQLGHRFLVPLLSGGGLHLGAGLHCLVIVLVVVLLQIGLSLADKLGNLGLVLGLHRLGLLQCLGILRPLLGLLLGGIDAVPLQILQGTLVLQHLIGSVGSEGVNFLLDAAHKFINGRAELLFLLRGQDLCIIRYHAISPLIGISRSGATALPGWSPWCLRCRTGGRWTSRQCGW